MAIMGCNLDEVKSFIEEISRIRSKIKNCEGFRREVLSQGTRYNLIKSYFQEFTSFLKYPFEGDIKDFYRVRKIDSDEPYSSKKDLIYPCLLYTSDAADE